MTFADAEPWLRGGAFLLVLVAVALWEGLAPRRARSVPRRVRWRANLALLAVDTILVRLIAPAAVVGVAWYAERAGIGLLHATALPAWFGVVLAVVALDLVLYAQHRLMHALPPLWRLHRVHHSDADVDVTTGVRFHPAEVLVSLAIKSAAVLVLGAPAAGVLVFEMLLNASSLFNHANASLPSRLEPLVRALVVTPDMHRVHHSVQPGEQVTNFGFALSLWDRLFGTWRDRPCAGHTGMTLGVDGFGDPRLWPLLVQPLRRA